MKIESWRFFFPAALMLGVAGLGLWALQLGGLWGGERGEHGFLGWMIGNLSFLCGSGPQRNGFRMR